MDELEILSGHIKKRNEIEEEISRIIRRPAEKGHITEFVASKIFSIKLNDNASKTGYDGKFQSGKLKGKKVDIKCHAVNEHLLNLNPNIEEEVYLLVFTGQYRNAGTSKGEVRPYCISNVYLFNEGELCNKLRGKVKIGVATSVKNGFWDESVIYPENTNQQLFLNEEQHSLLQKFACTEVS